MIKPLSTQIEKDGIRIAGMAVEDLAKDHGTPLYVIDKATLTANVLKYTQLFNEEHPNFLIAYASKANLTVGLAKILNQLGCGFDVVSAGELFTVLKAGVHNENIIFHGNNKSEQEIEMALEHGIRLIIDNETELETIIELAEKHDTRAKTLLRLKPEIEAHTHDYIKTGQIDSKFGIEKKDLIRLSKKLIDHPLTHFHGIHAHIGSQIFDTTPYEDLVEILWNHVIEIKNELNYNVREINIGGGVGVQYIKSDDPPDPLEIIRNVIKTLHQKFEDTQLYGCSSNYPRIILEPGRSVIATAGVTLYTIGAIKRIEGIKNYVFIDGGMADNPRPILYGAEHTFEISGKQVSDTDDTYTIAGKFCESGDIIGTDIKLSNPKKGDVLVVYGTGAYNYSMSSNYNRFTKPAMLIADSGKANTLVARETLTDIIRNDK